MYNSLTLVPAYGRDYKSKKALMEDWEQGKDFYIETVTTTKQLTYINKDQISSLKSYTHLHFRYNKQTQIHVVKL